MRLKFWKKKPVVEKPLMPVGKSRRSNQRIMRTAHSYIAGKGVSKYVPPIGCQLTENEIHPVVISYEYDKDGKAWQLANGVRTHETPIPPEVFVPVPRPRKRFWK